jgi:hypothetical protein
VPDVRVRREPASAARHARPAGGMARLPFGFPVEVEMILEVP